MVTIINFKERTKEDGSSFFVLEIQGGLEMVKSQTTGQFYATAKKAYLPSTFDAITCQALIGTQMPGKIIKQECEPYEYTIRDTGEIITLAHRFVFESEDTPKPKTPEKSKSTIESFITSNHHSFSDNGIFQESK